MEISGNRLADEEIIAGTEYGLGGGNSTIASEHREEDFDKGESIIIDTMDQQGFDAVAPIAGKIADKYLSEVRGTNLTREVLAQIRLSPKSFFLCDIYNNYISENRKNGVKYNLAFEPNSKAAYYAMYYTRWSHAIPNESDNEELGIECIINQIDSNVNLYKKLSKFKCLLEKDGFAKAVNLILVNDNGGGHSHLSVTPIIFLAEFAVILSQEGQEAGKKFLEDNTKFLKDNGCDLSKIKILNRVQEGSVSNSSGQDNSSASAGTKVTSPDAPVTVSREGETKDLCTTSDPR